MFNSYLKLYPDGCQLKFFHFNGEGPVKRTDSFSNQAHSDYVSLSRSRKKVYDYARSNDFTYFVTLTFDPQKVDSFSCDDSFEHMRNWLNRMRKRFPDLRYLGVPELHKSGRFHFHFLMSDDIKPVLVLSDKKYKGRTVYNVGSYRFGWTTAIEVYDKSKIPSYMVKYITKDLKSRSPNKRRYWNSHNLVLPKNFASYFTVEEFSSILEKLDITYATHKESDASYCDFYEVSFDSLGELLPFLENYREHFDDYSGIPEGFFPVGSTETPFD